MTDTRNQPRSKFYEPELDVLRFCAFLGVFCFHAIPSDYGFLVRHFGALLPALLLAVRNALAFGVCMFFLLSSYLITKLLIIERETTGSIHLKSFYYRRILRIWPLYLSFLTAMWILGRFHVFYPIEPGRMLAFLFFAGNIYSGIFGFTYNPILPLWTVSIEEQFYIVWPPLVRALRGSLRFAAVAVIGVSIIAIFVMHRFASDVTQAVWTSSFVHFQFFALGALFAVRFSKQLPTFSLGFRAGLMVCGAAFLLVAAGPLHVNYDALPPVSAPLLVAGYELAAIGVSLQFLAFLGAAQGGIKIPPALTYLGRISYGLYVFHYLSLQVCGSIAKSSGFHNTGFRFVGGACLTLILAMLSYRFLETPFLLLKKRFELVQTRPV
jgi:peptidoglycan/LPS O-acetylase OafA/YrhL